MKTMKTVFLTTCFVGIVCVACSQSSTPLLVKIGNNLVLPGEPTWVTIRDNIAYVACYTKGLSVVDLSDPGQPCYIPPAHEDDLDTQDLAHVVSLSGNYAYVADWSGGLVPFDISNPLSPVKRPAYILDEGGYFGAVFAVGNYAYVGHYERGLTILDISTPASPLKPSGMLQPNPFPVGGYAEGVVVVGDYAFLAAYENGLKIVNVSNPLNPRQIIPNPALNIPGKAETVTVAGNYAYVAAREGDLVIVDVSNPEVPSVAYPSPLHPYVDYPGLAEHVAIKDNYAFVASYDGGLNVVDISDPYLPVLVESHVTGGLPLGVAVSGSYVYVACHAAGLATFKLNNIEATVDIDPDTLNKKSNGRWITAFITLPDGYNVADIVPASINIVKIEGESCPSEYGQPADLTFTPQIGDRDEDGIPDLTVKFDRQTLVNVLCIDDVSITIEGNLTSGLKFSGTDKIRVINRGK